MKNKLMDVLDKIDLIDKRIKEYQAKLSLLEHYCNSMKESAKSFHRESDRTDGIGMKSYLTGKADGIETFVKMIEVDILEKKL